MKRNLIIATIAAVGLAAPAGAFAASSASHSSPDISKVEQHAVGHDASSRDRGSVERQSRDMKSASDSESPDRSATPASPAHDKSSPDASVSKDGGFDR